jgi:hypothetical protein
MKTLLFGVVLIVLLGVAGFFYRNVMEQRGSPEPVACTMDAKVCPDGSAVGRTGPSCEFALCGLPNAEDSEIGLGFVIPQGYVSNRDAIGADPSLRVVLDNNDAPGGIPHSIIVRRFEIPENSTAEKVILEKTMLEPSGMQPESIEEFTTIEIEGREFFAITVERFEAIVHSAYYLPRTNDLLVFEVLERDVVDWMEPGLVIEELPEHQALREMLRTLQTGE